MKKLLLCLLAMAMVLAMASCGETETTSSESVAQGESSLSDSTSSLASDAVSETSSQQEAEITFTVTAVDQNGDPVANVFVQLCNDSTCTPQMTNEQGIAAYTLEITDGCKLSVLSAPAGYTYEGEKDIYLEAGASRLTVTLTKEA